MGAFDDRLGASHAHDPATSRDAARANLPRSGGQRLRVLEALVARRDGATFEELIADTGIESSAKRLTELVKGGFAFKSERRRPTHTGSTAVVHVATAAGRREVELSRQAETSKAAGGPTIGTPARVGSSADHEPVGLFDADSEGQVEGSGPSAYDPWSEAA